MSIHDLPAIDWLGYSLDMTRSAAMDTNAATRAVLKARRIVNINTDEGLREVSIEGVLYNCPKEIGISDDAQTVQSNFITYGTGAQASAAFREDPSLGMRYFAVSGPASATHASEKAFVRGNQYGFYSFTSNVYRARLRDYVDLLNENALLRGVGELTRPFVGTNSDVLKQYKSFFERYGSHVLIDTNYGARFQLNVWASNETPAVNEKFANDVKYAFGGIPSGGYFDPSVKDQPQYKIFSAYMQKLISVLGGNTSLASDLAADPSNYQTFVQWTNSQGSQQPMLLGFKTIAVWTLMSFSANGTLRDFVEPLDSAFTYIITHPQPYKTAVVFDIQSDWAEFNLLTPGAVIIPDSKNPYPPTNMVASGARVQWGKEYSHAYDRKTLRFFVVNDGSPLDFSISHGSKAGQVGNGRADAIIENISYLNDRITDNVWNTMWFYRAPAAAVPETSNVQRRTDARPWDEVLHEYLDQIGAR